MAFDRTARSVDSDGHMRVEFSRISKANICPYRGNEIPDWDRLGLDANRIYRLLRDPRELEKGAHTFDGKPLLMHHAEINAELPRQDLWVGTVGVCKFEPPYLVARPLTVLTQDALNAINSEEQRELSAAYRYDAEMQPGTYGGESYDGRMVNIRGNHVAIVSRGRAGSDVHVADELPPELKRMALKNPKAVAAVLSAISPLLAMDAETRAKVELALDGEANKFVAAAESVVTLDEKEMSAACDEALSEKRKEHGEDAELSEDEKEMAYEKARKAKDKKAKDKAGKHVSQNMDGLPDPNDHRRDFRSNAQDSAITADQMTAAVKSATDKVRADARAAAIAREAVRPIVGTVSMAMDSADDIYAFALEKAGVKTKGVHPSAFPALLDMAVKQTQGSAFALDAAPVAETDLDSLLGLKVA
jgi:uncharacterized protein